MTAKRPRPASAQPGDELAAVDIDELPGHLIRLVNQAHKRMWAEEVSADITSPQYGILNAILADPGIDQKTAGEVVGIDKSTVGDVVARLVQRGLILTIRDPSDQRRNVLHLSRVGRRVIAELGPRVIEMNRKLVAALTAQEQAQLIRLLGAIIESAPEEGGS